MPARSMAAIGEVRRDGHPEMPIHYDLHVWLYRHNPAGMFAMWNPSVHCPAG
jgi:hypothetical protein